MSDFQYWNIIPIGYKWYKTQSSDNTASRNLHLLTFNRRESENKTFNLPFLPNTNSEGQIQVCVLDNGMYKIGGRYPQELFVYVDEQITLFVDALVESERVSNY